MVKVREVIPALDFWRLPVLLNRVEQEPVTIDTLYRWHFRESPGRVQRRVVAEDARGTLIGYGILNREAYLPPHEFYLWVMSDPDCRGDGIGRALLHNLEMYARLQQPAALTSEVADNDPLSLAWAERRGFRVARHSFASILELSTFDEDRFAGTIERVEAAGIHFATMADFPDSRAYQQHLFELNRETALDIPNYESAFPTFDAFRSTVFESEWYQPEGQIVALLGDEWVAMSAIRYIAEDNSMYNNMTGVRRPYRGRGIALALKLLTIRYARARGATFIRTHNDSANTPMLGINRKLGYRPETGIYWLRKRVED